MFGHVQPGLEDRQNGTAVNARKSQVELRLDQDFIRPRSDWPKDKFSRINNQVTSDLYLGYGAINPTGRRQYLTDQEQAKLRLRFPSEHADCLGRTLGLMAWFGTLGSRSRNGWGSLQMATSDGNEIPELSHETLSPYLRELSDCLKLDWPHAIGMDNGRPLVWQSDPVDSWMEAINVLAKLKKAMRDKAKDKNPEEIQIGGIHLLGYPVGGKFNLGNSGRLATPIRFKVCKENNQYRCLAFHIPTDFPESLQDELNLNKESREWIKKNQMKVFRAVHQVIDSQASFNRIGRIDSA